MYSTVSSERPKSVHGQTDRPLKILVFPLTWVLAHVGRTIEIAKALRAQGHEVVFAGDDPTHPSSRLSHAMAQGFRTVHVQEPQWHVAWKRFHDHGAAAGIWDFFNHHKWAPLDTILEDMIRVTQEEKPDLLLGDSSIGVSTVGHILGIPAAGVLNAYNTEFFKPWGFYRGFIRACDKAFWAPTRARIFKKYGAQPVDAFDLLQQIPLLSPDLEAFHAPHGSYPNWTPIGPLLSEPPAPLPDWHAELGDGQTNVYITMGSTGLLEPLLLRTYETLAKAPYRFVVTTGNQVSAEAIAKAPANFRFAAYAPGSQILEHCKAMVFHGGNGSMYQALAAGVPMLALPSHLEQHASFTPALREGFGRKASARKINGEQLLAEIRHLVENPSYRANAWRHRAAVLHANAAQKAARLLEQHAQRHRTQAAMA